MGTSGLDAGAIDVPSERIFWVLWVFVTAWLLACAFLVTGEYGDGYQTIVNSRYLFGDSPEYYFHRGPMAAILLWPVEVLVDLFDVGPLEVTPYHLYSAVLHSLYLMGCWLAIRSVGASPVASILAFAAAISTVVFYAYSPYLSHDILPGLFFLLMIFIADRWLRKGSWGDAMLLVGIGAAVVLFKQTYALFWIAIVAYAAMAMIFRWDDARVDWRKLGMLLSFAAISASLTWIGYAWFTGDEWSYVPWYMRPWELALGVQEVFGKDADIVFPADLYLRNLHNYGILAMLLVIPGVVLALRGNDARLRMIAVCWAISAIAMQVVTFKEVRYLLFLAPLTAVLIAPTIDWAVRRRVPLIAMFLVLAIDQFRGFNVAATSLTASGAIDPPRFYESAGTGERVVASKFIPFVYQARSPLKRDTYHGIYDLGARLYFALQEGAAKVQRIDDTSDLRMAMLQEGDRVYLATSEVRRFTPYSDDNVPHMLPTYTAIAGRAVPMTLRRQGGSFAVAGHENSFVMLVPDSGAPGTAPLLANAAIEAGRLERIYGSLDGRSSLEVTGIVIDALCQADSCRYR